jgi:hypothetical protein
MGDFTMISVYAKVEAEKGTPIEVRESENFINNNASQSIDSVVNKIVSGSNPFILGCSDFSAGAELIDEVPPFFAGNEIADWDGRLYYSYKLSVIGDDVFSSLTIVFDTYNNHHPSTINIDGTNYDVKLSRQVFAVPEQFYHTIIIDNYTPNFPLRIQGVTSTVSIEIGVEKMLNVEFSGLDRSNPQEIGFGIHSNSGSIEFVDADHTVKIMKDNNTLLNSKVTLFLRNRYRDMQIGSFIVTDGDYSKRGGSSTLRFQDRLPEWQNVTIPNDFVLSFLPMTLEGIRQAIATKVKGLDIVTYYTSEASTRWNATWVKNPYVIGSSFWSFMVKACELTGCYISCDEKGRAVIAYGGGT